MLALIYLLSRTFLCASDAMQDALRLQMQVNRKPEENLAKVCIICAKTLKGSLLISGFTDDRKIMFSEMLDRYVRVYFQLMSVHARVWIPGGFVYRIAQVQNRLESKLESVIENSELDPNNKERVCAQFLKFKEVVGNSFKTYFMERFRGSYRVEELLGLTYRDFCRRFGEILLRTYTTPDNEPVANRSDVVTE